jgi:hypothetical protein
MSLVNAYYLGYVIENLLIIEDFKYKKQIPPHYERIARLTYDLFEYAPKQIMATKFLTVQSVRTLNRKNLLRLREHLMTFDGTQVPEEEVVTEETIDKQ